MIERCNPNYEPSLNPKCRVAECRICEGTGVIKFLFFRGRYRKRIEIARWFIAQREWKGAVLRSLGSALYLKRGTSFMRLDGFTAAELRTLTGGKPDATDLSEA